MLTRMKKYTCRVSNHQVIVLWVLSVGIGSSLLQYIMNSHLHSIILKFQLALYESLRELVKKVSTSLFNLRVFLLADSIS